MDSLLKGELSNVFVLRVDFQNVTIALFVCWVPFQSVDVEQLDTVLVHVLLL